MSNEKVLKNLTGSEIAIIGVACRFPGAKNPGEFWDNLKNGVESITHFTDEELLAEGVSPELLKNPNYVKAAPILEDYDKFDASFFGYSPMEAELMDPQHRLFIECAWEALEDAGYNPETYKGTVGVYGGAKTDTYLFNISSNRELIKSLDAFQIALGNDLGCLATRISYKFDLRGPSYAIHTACSTSLVALHLACNSLLIDECQMAIAGGVTVNVPHKTGYLYEAGGILSPDGHCRSFDAEAGGTLFGNGAGIVVLKRLEDAINDGDHVYAVIRGTATNNDGSQKASFTAPGVDGQTKVVLEALASSEIDPESISYVEAHGTGTNLGDPIEILALTNAFRANTDKKGFCAVGSVKSNIGHLDAAAGISSLIKTVMALKHEMIPPSLHFKEANPKIDFENSPFYVNTSLAPWKTNGEPRRAGVSSFGFGSTNAHIILEEAPALEESSDSKPWQLLTLSARSEEALETATANLADYLRKNLTVNLADAAYTLKVGRKGFAHRKTVLCRNIDEAIKNLEGQSAENIFTGFEERSDKPVTFMFSGQGSQYVNMGKELYEFESTFKAEVDRCASILMPHVGLDIRTVLYPAQDKIEDAAAQLSQTRLTQPVLFVIEYALAKTLMKWGVKPQAMVGHSIGEYVAACIAGVLSLEDALHLVAERGKLMQSLPGGAMLAVPCSEAQAKLYLNSELSLATVNSPQSCVIAGSFEAIEALEKKLGAENIQCRRLHTSHAFHSHMMEPILAQFTALVQKVRLNAPKIPYVSNVTGTWITKEEAMSPDYWVKHLRGTVRFADCAKELLQDRSRVLIEVGPGQTLATLSRQNRAEDDERIIVTTLPHPNETRSAFAFLLGALGKLWVAGAQINWKAFYADEIRYRVPLPTYPFERQRYWIDTIEQIEYKNVRNVTLDKKENIDEWFYKQVWQKAETKLESTDLSLVDNSALWVLFEDECGLADKMAKRLADNNQEVVRVKAGGEFDCTAKNAYAINPKERKDYESLFKALKSLNKDRANILHLWTVAPDSNEVLTAEMAQDAQVKGFYSLLLLAQALGNTAVFQSVDISVVSNNMQKVTEGDIVQPEKAIALGACKVIPKEYENMSCRSVDITFSKAEEAIDTIVDGIFAEVVNGNKDMLVAYRDGERFSQGIEALTLDKSEGVTDRLKQGGVYLVTGGLGGIGFVLAEYLAKTVQAKLIITGRAELPAKDEWAGWLQSHAEDDAMSRRIKKVQQLESYGAEVLVVSADVTRMDAMAGVREKAIALFGEINGVIHAAGTAGGGIIQIKTPEMAGEVLAPRMLGTMMLDATFAGDKLDFTVLCASLQSTMGDFGQVDYCAANAFMDAYANVRGVQSESMFVALDWDNWSEVGIAVDTEVPPELQAWRDEILAKGIKSDEALQVFKRVLESNLAQVIVSTQDLPARLELANSIRQEDILQELNKGKAATSTGPKTDKLSSVNLSGSQLEQKIADIWKKVLGVNKVGVNDNFFDLGGNSLSGIQLVSEIKRELDVQLSQVVIYEAPTVSALAKYIRPEQSDSKTDGADKEGAKTKGADSGKIAIVGMACRLPGANSPEEFWQNLCNGVESISFFTEEELAAEGIDDSLLGNPSYVKAAPILENVDKFDASFFGYTPREAEVMDPQQRIFLECAWEALEASGCDPEKYKGLIGVYGGSSMSTYLFNIHSNPEVMESVGHLQAIIGNDKDSLTTGVSYKLNLKGPSVAVQTYCSTSLVALHMACQSIIRGECDMALAGGSSVTVPQKSGYMYQEGNIVSPDGHCRAFDADANGTLFGSGVGVVLLKRLDDAIADGDTIFAVVKGSAINNDGSLKVGYTAPSVEGQAEVIAEALENAGVTADTIGYIEAHGTGTQMGDPIEITALTKAFRATTDKNGYCKIGSVKTNIGHLDRAAGVAGLIKTVLSLKHKLIPPTLNFKAPNPKIDFANSPFVVNTELTTWGTDGTPRRAGISALGFGGTNAHIILEEPPESVSDETARAQQLVLLSARSESALEKRTEDLVAYLKGQEDVNLADVAYTLQVGRRDFSWKRIAVCKDTNDAINMLETIDGKRVFTKNSDESNMPVVFMFPGQGAQYVNMGLELYQTEELFKETVDACAEILKMHLGTDLREVIYPKEISQESAAEALSQTKFTQPALFVIEYAMAKLLMGWGINPEVMIGHSVGEYVAATIAGVLTLEDALALVAARGRMIQELPGGTMLSVPLAESELGELLETGVSLAAVNAPKQCVLSGAAEEIAQVESILVQKGVEYRALHTSHAFHSKMMEPILEAFTQLVAKVKLGTPEIPYISCVTGDLITEADVKNPAYWATHLRQGVRYADGISKILSESTGVMLEVGPGQTLSTLTKRNLESITERTIISTTRHPQDNQSDVTYLLTTLGKLWLAGVSIDWDAYYGDEKRKRIALPTYPFERQSFWIDAKPMSFDDSLSVKKHVEDWFYVPSWKRAAQLKPYKPGAFGQETKAWLVFSDKYGLSSELVKLLRAEGQSVVTVALGDKFRAVSDNSYEINPAKSGDYSILFSKLQGLGLLPGNIVHTWSYTENSSNESFDFCQSNGLYSLLNIAGAVKKHNINSAMHIWAVSSDVQQVNGDEELQPEKATILGACKVITKENPSIACHSVDYVFARNSLARQAAQLLNEISAANNETVGLFSVAYRGNFRWVPAADEIKLEADNTETELKEKGVYLVTGGFDGIGRELADHLAHKAQARLVLPDKMELPEKDKWERYLSNPAVIDEEEIFADATLEIEMEDEQQYLKEFIETKKDNLGLRKPPIGMQECLDEFCASLIYGYFAKSVDTKKGKIYDSSDLMKALRVLPKFEKFYQYMLRVLAQDKLITLDGAKVEFAVDPADVKNPESLLQTLLTKYPEAKAGFEGLYQCATNYTQALSGDVEAVSILYPNGSSDMLLAVTESQNMFSNVKLHQSIIVDLVSRLEKVHGERKFRILEVGAGDGKLSWDIIEALKDKNIEYHFTDIGKSFVISGEKRALQEGYDFMKFGVFDISQDPVAQGYEKYSFDVILALDVVHATPSIRETMGILSEMLVPNGLIMLVEATKPQRWVDMIWGLAEGWWYFSDAEIRKGSPLLSPERWENALSDQGFKSVRVYPQEGTAREEADHSLIITQGQAEIEKEDYKQLRAAKNMQKLQQIQQRIRQALVWEKNGAEVLIQKTDIADLDEMKEMVSEVSERFGAINGVIHGAVGFVSKVKGLMILDKVFADKALDFAFVVSSVTNYSGEMVKAEECAANIFADSYATKVGFGAGKWQSINWDAWQNAEQILLPGAVGLIKRKDGVKAFDFIRTIDTLPQVIVSPRNIKVMLEKWNTVEIAQIDESAELNIDAANHERPNLSNTYIAPRNENEQAIVNIWKDVLGIAQVGVDDSFFDLGGDSLQATQLNSRLRNVFSVDLPLSKFFEAPTVEGTLVAIEAIKAQQKKQDEEEILRMLAELSDDEVEAELKKLG